MLELLDAQLADACAAEAGDVRAARRLVGIVSPERAAAACCIATAAKVATQAATPSELLGHDDCARSFEAMAGTLLACGFSPREPNVRSKISLAAKTKRETLGGALEINDDKSAGARMADPLTRRKKMKGPLVVPLHQGRRLTLMADKLGLLAHDECVAYLDDLGVGAADSEGGAAAADDGVDDSGSGTGEGTDAGATGDDDGCDVTTPFASSPPKAKSGMKRAAIGTMVRDEKQKAIDDAASELVGKRFWEGGIERQVRPHFLVSHDTNSKKLVTDDSSHALVRHLNASHLCCLKKIG